MSRLIIVSNRLPFTAVDGPDGIDFQPSSGGLVSALTGYLEKARAESGLEAVWVGWPGADIAPELRGQTAARALEKHGAHLVFISREEMDRFYNGFCNNTIWPLFHYFPSYVQYNSEEWESYVRVNEAFCAELLAFLRPDDTVWVHDYQLLLLPGLLRKHRPDQNIGFFLHIPFPSFEIFRLLPFNWRTRLLEGMLGADLIGFHTHDYTQYFLHCILRDLGREHYLGQITLEDRLCCADTFPIGIDYEKFRKAAQSERVAEIRREFAQTLGDRKAIFSVDRLDYTKGILHRLRGYEAFLAEHPEWHGRALFILSVVPSREEVGQYQQMKQELDENIGRINGRFGRVDWVPILYQYRHLDFTTLVALYNLSDVALITPLRDGMNLVAKEYLASKPDSTGVLVLSEMTGAARELGEALLINPRHKDEISGALERALSMSPQEQVARNRPMQERISLFDANAWAKLFLTSLRHVEELRENLRTRHLQPESGLSVAGGFFGSSSSLLFLDYDGTLVPFASDPNLAAPDEGLLRILTRLAARPGTRVCLISGRGREKLTEWFKHTGVDLVAEHGAWIRRAGGGWENPQSMRSDWMEALKPILYSYVDRLPGSFLEEKEFSLAWHYRKANFEMAAIRAKELKDALIQYTANLDVQVLEGKKVVEVRNAGINKGSAVAEFLAGASPGFILAIGDDQTDEDMFRVLPAGALTIRVGPQPSLAHHFLRDFREVRTFLTMLADSPHAPPREAPGSPKGLLRRLLRRAGERLGFASGA
jgi:trehalose 6-phosphate synthase/phosphatase